MRFERSLRRTTGLAAIAIAVLFGLGCLCAEAQEPSPSPSPAAAAHSGGIDPKALAYFAAGIGAGLTIMGGAAGIGRLAASAMEGIARQPNAAADIRGAMIVAAGLIEGVTFFALIVTTLLVVFV